MIHKEDGQVQLECDKKDCKETYRVYPSSAFSQMISNARQDGWQVFKRDGEFKHYCSWKHSWPEK